ncbi:MAG TPA: tetratricopeptide repeat protein, partial [Gemmataceae bacterium]|nr:tetratricopeptide repeat protein [Gemmataceae bacterium]
MNGATGVGRRRLLWWTILGIAFVAFLALAAGVCWRQPWRSRAEAPPPGPSDAALAGVDPEVAAAVREARTDAMRAPRSVDAWGRFGQVLLANGFPADADAVLARAEDLQPDEVRWPYLRAFCLLSTDRDAGLAALRRAVAACDRSGETDATPYLLIAELCIERNDPAQAETLCQRVLDREPDNARAHLDMGLIALGRNDLDASISHLRRAALSPTMRQHALTQLAAAYQRKGDLKAAADYAQQAQQPPADAPWRDPYFEEMERLAVGKATRFQQLDRLAASDRWDEAATQYQRMAAEDPNDPQAYLKLGVLLTKHGRLAEGEQALRKAATLAPQDVDPTYYLAVALYMEGEQAQKAGDASSAADKFRAAADAAQRAVDVKADHAQAYAFLGLALKQLGRRAEAIAALRAAVRRRPESAELHQTLGEAL